MTDETRSGLLLLRDRPMVFVEDLEAPELTGDDRNHLERALRLRPGASITVADGRGRWRAATLGTTVEPDGEIVAEEQNAVVVTIGFSPVKGDRSDLVVQKLTELGVEKIVPLHTERSVVRWDDQRATKNLSRHNKIAREAAMQSRNPWLPVVEPIRPLAEFLNPGGGEEAVLADPAGQPLSAAVTKMAIGPEGGFSPDELHGQPTVALPGRILRTETAAITAAVLMVNARRG